MKTIFVNIASYLDHQILLTVYDALNTAKYPDRLRFGILHQHDEDNYFLFEEFDNDKRFKIKNVNYRESNGACWARYECNKLYNNEDYVLMIDSHSRFDQDWDEEFIKMHNKCLEFSDKACISSYCTKFDTLTELKYKELIYMYPCYKDDSNLVLFKPVERTDSGLKLHAFWGACLSFSDGKFFQEVPYDPDLYFHGEEITIAMRAWTRGWDFYLPDKPLVYHETSDCVGIRRKTNHYTNPKANELNEKSLKKSFDICSGKIEGIYGLGNKRSIKDYEVAAGINFKDQYIYDTNQARPYPCFESYKDLKKNTISDNRLGKLTIDWSDVDLSKEDISSVETIEICLHLYNESKSHFIKRNKQLINNCTIDYYFEPLFGTEVNYDQYKVVFNRLTINFYDKYNNILFGIKDNIKLKLITKKNTYNYIQYAKQKYSVIDDHTVLQKKSFFEIQAEELKVYFNYTTKNKDFIYKEKLKEDLKNKIIFIHIPKTAGMSFFKSIKNFWMNSPIVRLGLHGDCKSLIDETYDGFIKDNNIKFITIYRDPFERFYSAYTYGKIQKSKHNPRKRSRTNLHWYQELYSKAFKDMSSFESFCKNIYNYYLDQEKDIKEFIIKPQFKFIIDYNNNIIADYILDFNNLDKEWVNLCKKYNYNKVTPLLKTNTSGNNNYIFNKVYNKETIKIVENIYKRDINIYEQIRTGKKYVD